MIIPYLTTFNNSQKSEARAGAKRRRLQYDHFNYPSVLGSEKEVKQHLRHEKEK